MKSSVSLESALLVIIYFATGTCTIIFLNPTIRTPGDAKAENQETKSCKSPIFNKFC